MSRLDDRSNQVPLRAAAIVRKTQKAYLIRFTEDDETIESWFPISKVYINNDRIPCVPQWMLDKALEKHRQKK